MSRLLRGVALGAAILVTATACTSAGAGDDGDTGGGSSSTEDGGGYGDLYYAVYEQNGDGYTSKLLRWDGTEGGEVETVAETQDTRLFHTATITGDGAFAVFAEGREDGVLQFLDLKTEEKKTIMDFPRVGDTCFTPAFAPGSGGELLVPQGSVVTVHYPKEVEVGNEYAIEECMPQPAIAEGDEEPSIFYISREGEIMFMKPDREVVNTGLGQKAADFLDAELHELTVSPTGSQVCVEAYTNDRNGQDPYSRHGTCQVLIDVATGEFIKHFDGEEFAVKYTGEGLMLRKDGELSYYPKSDDLAKPTETLSEPEELAEAQLIAVTDT